MDADGQGKKAEVLVFSMNNSVTEAQKKIFEYHGSKITCDYCHSEGELMQDINEYKCVVVQDYVDPDLYDSAYQYKGIHSLETIIKQNYKGNIIVSLACVSFNPSSKYIDLFGDDLNQKIEKRIKRERFKNFKKVFVIGDLCSFYLPMIIEKILAPQ